MRFNLSSCSVENLTQKDKDKDFASYKQDVNLTVFGKKVLGHVRLNTVQGSMFPEKLLLTYSKIMKNLDSEVTRVVKMVTKIPLNASGYTASESEIKSQIDYVSVFIGDHAIKGKLDSIWYQVTFAFKGDDHLFSMDCIDGKYEDSVSMNG